MTVIWVWLVGLLTETLNKFQGLAQITAFLNIPKGCSVLGRKSYSDCGLMTPGSGHQPIFEKCSLPSVITPRSTSLAKLGHQSSIRLPQMKISGKLFTGLCMFAHTTKNSCMDSSNRLWNSQQTMFYFAF